jgi:uncharacterized protein YndB with AHSA1/START domain
MPGFSGISECRVLEVVELRRLVYTWTVLPTATDATPPPPMTVTWTLAIDHGSAPSRRCRLAVAPRPAVQMCESGVYAAARGELRRQRAGVQYLLPNHS